MAIPVLIRRILRAAELAEYIGTFKGDRKFSFGKENENEVVFVQGKSGRIEFVFSELYSAKRD